MGDQRHEDVVSIRDLLQNIKHEDGLEAKTLRSLDLSSCRITNSGHANWFFVLAKTDPGAKPAHSMTGFVVDGNSPGIVLGKKEINMGESFIHMALCKTTHLSHLHDRSTMLRYADGYVRGC